MRTQLDLFSGIGGFALACRWAGVKTIGFAEIDDYASRVLAKNFPGVTNYGDVRNVPDGLSAWLVTGGFPCQPFSVAGKRGGTADDRYLWPEMAGVIERVRPTWVLAENVFGIVRMELDTVLSDLERIHYTAWPLVVPACGVDAPHRRERVWIVAHANGAGLERRGEYRQHAAQRAFGTSGESYSADWQLESRVGDVVDGLPARLDGSGLTEAVWSAEPNIPRVAHGVKDRVNRLRGLGNAIVPQVAYQLIRLMIAAEEESA
jgi:DNA (cytosine-5)-methyltransferase 1